MSASILSELTWLPRAPHDFRARLKIIGEGKDRFGQQLRSLAGHALNINQLTSLSKVIQNLSNNARDLTPLIPVRLGLLGSATTTLIGPALIASAARHGILLSVIEGEYGQALQEVIDPQSPLNQAKPDFVLLSMNWRDLPLRNCLGNAETSEQSISDTLASIKTITNAVAAGCGANMILETLPRPAEQIFGSYDLRVPGTSRHAITEFNRALIQTMSGTPHLLLDAAGIAENVGLAEWHDPTAWHTARLPFAQTFVPLYADHVARLLAAAKGLSRRCLILDLDNTLWSGVIGDDGLEGIVIGQGSPVGEAYLATQSVALALKERGIVLAVSSKNEDKTARTPFQKHPDMLMHEDDIAVFQANWQDKASNIKAIAESLSLGLQSMVLVDDNPAEREQVRQTLPEVAVPELPDDPSLHARTLLASGYFEAILFSDEDRARTSFYQSNSARAVLLNHTGDLDSFLRSLEMTITFSPFDSIGRERIHQLISKSNQFNLTTRRYSLSEITMLEIDPHAWTLQVRLADRFGDNGMISVIICRKNGELWNIDTWLMSCRVLGRGVERAILQELAHAAKKFGVTRLRGTYIPSERNGMVKDHYAKLGFTQVELNDHGTTTWDMSIDEIPETDLKIPIHRTETI